MLCHWNTNLVIIVFRDPRSPMLKSNMDSLIMQSCYSSTLPLPFLSSKCQGYNSSGNESSQAQSTNYPLQETALIQEPKPLASQHSQYGWYFMPSHRDFNHGYSLSFSEVETLDIKCPPLNMHRRKNQSAGPSGKQLESTLCILNRANANEMQKRMEPIHCEISNKRALKCQFRLNVKEGWCGSYLNDGS
jgi:hypothetical protein